MTILDVLFSGLPESPVKVNYVFVCTYTGGNKVQNSDSLQGFGSRQGHVRLSILKHFGQGDFNTVQSHTLQVGRGGEGRGGERREGWGSILHVANHETRMCVSLRELTTWTYVCMPWLPTSTDCKNKCSINK